MFYFFLSSHILDCVAYCDYRKMFINLQKLMTALMRASENGHAETVGKLLSYKNCNINAQNEVSVIQPTVFRPYAHDIDLNHCT